MRQEPQGFTLSELIIAIALIGVVTVLVGNFVMHSMDLWRLTREQEDLQFKARTALRRITTEIREMQDAQNGAFAIAVANPAECAFYSNIDQDDDIERVRYFLTGTELRRGVIEPVGNPATYPSANEVVVVEVENAYAQGDVFSYYDELYTGTEAPLSAPFSTTDVHLVKIRFFVDDDTTSAPDGYELSTEITPRNLKIYAP